MTFASLDGSALDADGLVNGIFTVDGNLTLSNGGAITCNDPAAPTAASACPITIRVTQDMEMQAGSAILAENTVGGGTGGDITITVDGNMALRGPSGTTTGAKISSSRTVGTGGQAAGDITITVGNYPFTPRAHPAGGSPSKRIPMPCSTPPASSRAATSRRRAASARAATSACWPTTAFSPGKMASATFSRREPVSPRHSAGRSR